MRMTDAKRKKRKYETASEKKKNSIKDLCDLFFLSYELALKKRKPGIA